ncbi:hypothetical protein SERLA73DRAFT_186605 [Serpula lacrymans var. lacrymans S7.3]|uniref:Uncharacterized protein n=2 Tax=Serpula lacrymans var. lacrymans TaxID=341189 RepID=F8Q7K3_SERL3|nr:uncharacterized protein SERLADRAFT_475746 [Serpula lacrymans var. lacrymans S7.9]EGN95541.1 hypothetical protein SERLA73DRAFT_186605 [Serpula lacrymans var. lacrymans S7.3]EGO21067.1 hypothetical protein SERLADRAFT_475746 [Serpula lacrymans var. lacrymans S7.9]
MKKRENYPMTADRVVRIRRACCEKRVGLLHKDFISSASQRQMTGNVFLAKDI